MKITQFHFSADFPTLHKYRLKVIIEKTDKVRRGESKFRLHYLLWYLVSAEQYIQQGNDKREVDRTKDHAQECKHDVFR